jgi:acetyl esterase/lipase
MVMGSIESDDANAVRLCLQFEVTVIAIEYRLAPEHPFPAAIDDCFDVALWIFSNSNKEGWDLTKSIAYGGSAGGGLAIATGMNLRDHAANNFATIVAPYPMVDHKNSLPSTHRITDLGVWDRKANEESWAWYLGANNSFLDREQIHPYAAPLHAENLAGLPPVFIDVGDCDLFLDENINLVARLIEAGVSVEFHCYPGAFHASELLSPEATLSQRIWNTRFDYVRRWLT